MEKLIWLIMLFSNTCIRVADKVGVVPIVRGERFMRIRPNDVFAAHICYSGFLILAISAFAGLVFYEGVFFSLVFMLFFQPICYLFLSLLLRGFLEVLLYINRE